MRKIKYILFFLIISNTILSQNYINTKIISGFGHQAVQGIHEATNGKMYYTGFSTSNINFDNIIKGNFGLIDGIIGVTDNNGNATQVLSFGTVGNEYVYDITSDSLGNIYICGIFTQNNFDANPNAGTFLINQFSPNFSDDIFIVKLDSNHNFVWAKHIGNTLGGPDESCRSIAIDSKSNIYIGGMYSQADFDPNSGTHIVYSNGSAINSKINSYILKLDQNGNFIWVKTFDGQDWGEVIDMKIDKYDNIYAVGEFRNTIKFGNKIFTNLGNYQTKDIFLMKMDTLGNIIWNNIFGGKSDDNVNNISIINSKLYVLGRISDTCYLNPDTTLPVLYTKGRFDAFYSIFDLQGNYMESKLIGNYNSLNEEFTNAVEGLYGDVFFCGTFDSIIYFENSNSNSQLLSLGGKDNFVIHADSNNNYIRSFTISGVDNQNNADIIFTQNNTLIHTGVFEGTVDFDISANIDNKTSLGFTDVYIQSSKPYYTENDSCINAINIYCGDTININTIFATPDTEYNSISCSISNNSGIWYKLENNTSNNVIYTLSTCDSSNFSNKITVFSGDCNNLNCISSNSSICGDGIISSFTASPNSTYFVLINGDNQRGKAQLILNCEYKATNDSCISAITILCDDTIIGSTTYATMDSEYTACSINNSLGVWYKFIPDDLNNKYKISLCGNTDYNSKLSLFRGDCNNLICIEENNNECGDDAEIILTNTNEHLYYILVHSDNQTSGNFELKISCHLDELKENIINNNLEIFPNPNNGRFTIISLNEEINDLTIYDTYGKVLLKDENIKEHQKEIENFNFDNGVYIIIINNKYIKKIIISENNKE